MAVPSILGITPAEARKRYRRALRREYAEMLTAPVKRVLPQLANDLLALLMCAGLFIVTAVTLCLICGG